MKVRVRQTYRDKKTREIVYAGSVLEMEKERVDEINSANGGKYGTLVEKIEENIQEEEIQEEEDLSKLGYQELKKLAKEKGISAKGSKEELIEKIRSKGDAE